MKIYITNILATFAIIFSGSIAIFTKAIASETVFSCPATITTIPTVSKPIPNWSAATRKNEGYKTHQFDVATFTSGEPSMNQFLRPSDEITRNGVVHDVYEFSGEPKSEAWLVCYYKSTPVYFHKSVGFNPDKCEVSRSATAQAAATCK